MTPATESNLYQVISDMPIDKYIEDVQKQYKTGIAREHAYRPALKNMLEELLEDVTAINDPAHIKCGAPDFILHMRFSYEHDVEEVSYEQTATKH